MSCSPWGCKELDMTVTKYNMCVCVCVCVCVYIYIHTHTQIYATYTYMALQGALVVKNLIASAGRCKRTRLDPWVKKPP